MFFGDQQDVYRSLWANISKRQTLFVFVDDVRWNFTIDDFGKDRRHRGHFRKKSEKSRGVNTLATEPPDCMRLGIFLPL